MNKYGEPWKSEGLSWVRARQEKRLMAGIFTHDDVLVADAVIGGDWAENADVIDPEHRDRIIACVNALADVENPEAVKKLIEATRALQEVSSRPNSEVEYYMAKTRLYVALAKLDRKEPSCPPKP